MQPNKVTNENSNRETSIQEAVRVPQEASRTAEMAQSDPALCFVTKFAAPEGDSGGMKPDMGRIFGVLDSEKCVVLR